MSNHRIMNNVIRFCKKKQSITVVFYISLFDELFKKLINTNFNFQNNIDKHTFVLYNDVTN